MVTKEDKPVQIGELAKSLNITTRTIRYYEEIGLMGVKHLDFNRISAEYGFALDATDTRGVVTRAPSANRFEFSVHGKEAHAGAAPEKGINAIQIASRAIADLELGRIDEETTCNIGVIQGGLATNIIPNLVKVRGEVRSHNAEKLESVTQTIVSAFDRAAAESTKMFDGDELPKVDSHVEHDFTRTHIAEDHPVVTLAAKAARNLGREMVCKTTGGGADANVFFQQGIVTGVLGTGMQNMHTINESVRLDDMVEAVELLLEIINDGTDCRSIELDTKLVIRESLGPVSNRDRLAHRGEEV